MRDFLKLDVIMQKVSKLLKSGNKAKKVIKAFTLSWTLFNVIAVIWSLVPKTDKLDEVDPEELILAFSKEDEAEEPESDIVIETAEAQA